jgi:hypothetical protein
VTGRHAATVGLTTAERLIYGHLVTMAKARNGARLDLHHLAACCCLSVDVAGAAMEALQARRLVCQHADGRVVVTPDGGQA